MGLESLECDDNPLPCFHAGRTATWHYGPEQRGDRTVESYGERCLECGVTFSATSIESGPFPGTGGERAGDGRFVERK